MKNKMIRTFTLLSSVEAVLAGFWLLSLPSDGGAGMMGALSAQRLMILLPMVGALVLLVVFAIRTWKMKIDVLAAQKKKTIGWKLFDAVRIGLFGFNVLLALLILIAPIFLNAENEVYLFSSENPFVPRLMPLVVFLVLLGVQANLLMGLVKRPEKREIKETIRWKVFWIGVVFVVLIWGASLRLGWGVNVFDGWIADWGIPLLEWQVILLLVTFLHTFVFVKANAGTKKWLKIGRKEILIAVVLWAITFCVWNYTEFDFDGSYFNTAPTAPTYEIYPHSDARQYYSASVEFITGDGVDNSFARQYYVLLIALGNLVFDFNISKILTAQIVILSMIPGLLYLLAVQFEERLAGLFLALVVILRETNAIRNAGALNTTPVHLLMSDMVCLFLIVLNLYFAVRWVKAGVQENRQFFALLTGIFLGINIAMRIYVILFVPVLVVLLFFTQKERKMWWREMVFYGMGLAIAILPVLLRNYLATGVITLERPIFWDHFMNFSSMSNTTSAAETDPTLGGILHNLLMNVGPLVQKTGNHFTNDLLSNWMTFFATSKVAAEGTYFYYLVPDMATRWQNFGGARVLVTLGIGVLSMLGMARVLKRQLQAGLVLVSFYLTYALGMAWVGASGWRFILPVDWILLWFVILGVLQILDWFLPSNIRETDKNLRDEKQISPLATWSVGIGFLLLASVYLIRHLFLPMPYLERTSEENCELVMGQEAGFCEDALANGIRFEAGRLLYPSFYAKNTYFDQAKDYDAFKFQNFDRYTFTYIGEGPKQVFFPSEDDNLPFVNGMKVVVGLQEASSGWQVVYLYDISDNRLYSSIPFGD